MKKLLRAGKIIFIEPEGIPGIGIDEFNVDLHTARLPLSIRTLASSGQFDTINGQ